MATRVDNNNSENFINQATIIGSAQKGDRLVWSKGVPEVVKRVSENRADALEASEYTIEWTERFCEIFKKDDSISFEQIKPLRVAFSNLARTYQRLNTTVASNYRISADMIGKFIEDRTKRFRDDRTETLDSFCLFSLEL